MAQRHGTLLGSTPSSAALTTVYYTVFASPIGDLLLVGDGATLSGLYFPTSTKAPLQDPSWQANDGAFDKVTAQLRAYFARELTEFSLALTPHGTPFQQRVWSALRTIPYGTTTSYGRLAVELGDAKAVRAVGLANGRNPIPIIIPCHRVVGANGSLIGYGGGMDRKQWLLALEGRALPFI
ncbi:MAG: methylated-DNA--[protein]-cysteine S-methyltransferase [Chloroflexi bacterium]|nr:methylated-DNA--[protein]-cysteine S-methyltransferase [Chloroflexota bacterium]